MTLPDPIGDEPTFSDSDLQDLLAWAEREGLAPRTAAEWSQLSRDLEDGTAAADDLLAIFRAQLDEWGTL